MTRPGKILPGIVVDRRCVTWQNLAGFIQPQRLRIEPLCDTTVVSVQPVGFDARGRILRPDPAIEDEVFPITSALMHDRTLRGWTPRMRATVDLLG